MKLLVVILEGWLIR
ncbi:unnamed protein product [Lathyrus oleraceus]